MPAQPLTLRVIALYVSEVHGKPSVAVPALRLRPGYGIVGDSHMAERNVDDEGRVIPNRHFTAVHPGELGKMAHALGVPFVDPAWLKANICFTCADVENFTETFVPGTQLLDARGKTILEIRGVTDPCITGGAYVAAHWSHLGIEAQRFPKAAYLLRGIHGIALEDVTLQLHDTFTARLP